MKSALKNLALGTVGSALFLGLVAHFLVLSGTSAVPVMPPPSASDVKNARQIVRSFKEDRTVRERPHMDVQMTQAQMNSALLIASRIVPEVRGQMAVADGNVQGEVSLAVPWIGGDRWLNLYGVVTEYDTPFKAEQVKVGALPIPSGIANWAVREGLNTISGDALGDKIFGIPKRMRISDDVVQFEIDMIGDGDNDMVRSIFAALRGGALPDPNTIKLYDDALRRAFETGDLPTNGSFLPVVTFVLKRVLDRSNGDVLRAEYTAAMIALANLCGSRDFAHLIGDAQIPKSDLCNDLTFRGRKDTRRHFAVSAGLQAASNSGIAVSVGELKELNDTLGATGFDFTDIAANNSGVHLSNVIMSGAHPGLNALLTRILVEDDILLPFDGLPAAMTAEDFANTFGTIDSAIYKSEIAKIERKIKALPAYQ